MNEVDTALLIILISSMAIPIACVLISKLFDIYDSYKRKTYYEDLQIRISEDITLPADHCINRFYIEVLTKGMHGKWEKEQGFSELKNAKAQVPKIEDKYKRFDLRVKGLDKKYYSIAVDKSESKK